MRARFNRPAAARIAAVVTLLIGQAAMAQVQVDDVVVTTGFRPSSVTDRAGSATVIDAGLIDLRAARHLESVLDSAANVTMTRGASRTRFIQMRGVGDLEQYADPKHYPSVGLSIDGIDLGGVASAAMLFDVDQVEVLRGPQGTRFGASALAGQIYLLSAAPGEVFDGYLDASAGDYGDRSLGLAAGGPLAEHLSGRIAVQDHRGDGYMRNGYLGRDDTNNYAETTLRGRLRWSPNDAVTLDVTAIHFDGNNGYDAFSLDNTRTTLSDQPGNDNLGLSALGLRATWALDSGGVIEANLSAVESDSDYAFDEDWAFVGLCDGTLCNPGDGFSNTDRYDRSRRDTTADVRWLGETRTPSGRTLRYVTGVYRQDRDETLAREYYGPFDSDYLTDRLALYGQVDAALSDRVELTVGYRLEQFDDRYRDSAGLANDSSDRFGSGEIAVRYHLSARSSVYGLVARGNKPGGINTSASSVFALLEPRFQDFVVPRLQFARESLTNRELGIHALLASQRLALRAAIFSMTRARAQLETWFIQYDPFLWVGLLDTADGDNEGLEIDIDFAASERWRLRASLGRLQTSVDRLVTFDIDRDSFVSRDGIEQTQAPSWQVFVGSEWRFGDWLLAADVSASDSERYGYYHDGTLPRATVVNGSLQRRFGKSDVTLWARNLTDEDYAVHGLYFGNDPRKGYLPERYLQLGEPRVVGLSLRRAF